MKKLIKAIISFVLVLVAIDLIGVFMVFFLGTSILRAFQIAVAIVIVFILVAALL